MPTIAFFKPFGVVSHFTDPDGASTLADFIQIPGVYPAGRLDKDSEGLLILSDDGELIHRITAPESKLPKVYYAQVEQVPNETALRLLREGVVIEGRKTRPAAVAVLSDEPVLPPRPIPIRFRKNVPTCWLKLTLREGRKHQVRRMTAAVGHPTLRLVRVAIGPITLTGLQPGQWRELDAGEVRALG